MITIERNGSRVIKLFVPFEYQGKRVREIVLAPLRLEQVIAWQKGDYRESMDLLQEMAGSIVMQVRYPDADRVLQSFFEMLTPEIRVAIEKGEIPRPAEEIVTEENTRKEELTQAVREASTKSVEEEPTTDPHGIGMDLGEEAGQFP